VDILNVAAYKFVDLDAASLPALQERLKARALQHELKGSILLGTEGINLFLAAAAQKIQAFQQYLAETPTFADLHYKESPSAEQPFTRMLVRIKQEIISLGLQDIHSATETAPHIAPETLKQWYEQGRDMIVLDARNQYEVRLGTFEGATDLQLNKFRDFAQAIDTLDETYKEKPVVTFCTGGIRCEKAAALMQRKGFKQVYQLEGGILNYFERCGPAFYEGECFVFDKRVAVDANLQETLTIQCFACRNPLTLEEQHASEQVCPHCGNARPALTEQ